MGNKIMIALDFTVAGVGVMSFMYGGGAWNVVLAGLLIALGSDRLTKMEVVEEVTEKAS